MVLAASQADKTRTTVMGRSVEKYKKIRVEAVNLFCSALCLTSTHTYSACVVLCSQYTITENINKSKTNYCDETTMRARSQINTAS